MVCLLFGDQGAVPRLSHRALPNIWAWEQLHIEVFTSRRALKATEIVGLSCEVNHEPSFHTCPQTGQMLKPVIFPLLTQRETTWKFRLTPDVQEWEHHPSPTVWTHRGPRAGVY